MDGNGFAAPQDRLSALPDDLLLQILVLLPLIQAVRTCVLAWRWSKFWTQAAALHVVDKQVDGDGEPGRFARVVDSILDVYASQLGRARCYFCLTISREDNVDAVRLTSWARRAADLFEGDFLLSVETMETEDSESEQDEPDSEEEPEPDEIFELPYFEFAKKITLTLSDRLLCLALPTGGAGVFASLTHLVLMSLRFPGRGGSVLSEMVSSRCPCLVSLVLRHVQFVPALVLQAGSLTHLTLSCVQGLRLLVVVAPKLRAMTVQCCFVESKGALLQISAPSLLRFEWADSCPANTQVGPTDHLKTMVVGEIPQVAWHALGFTTHSNFDRIFSHFTSSTQVVLELHVPIHPEMGGHRKLMEHIVLPVQYTGLNLIVEPDDHMFGMSMFLLLKRCIGLRMLHLKLSKRKGDTCLSSCIWDNPPSWENQTILFNSLQEIVVSDFNGTSHEVDVVSFILKCAPSLHKINIAVAHGVQVSEETVLHFNKYPQVKWMASP